MSNKMYSHIFIRSAKPVRMCRQFKASLSLSLALYLQTPATRLGSSLAESDSCCYSHRAADLVETLNLREPHISSGRIINRLPVMRRAWLSCWKAIWCLIMFSAAFLFWIDTFRRQPSTWSTSSFGFLVCSFGSIGFFWFFQFVPLASSFSSLV